MHKVLPENVFSDKFKHFIKGKRSTGHKKKCAHSLTDQIPCQKQIEDYMMTAGKY